MSNAFFQVPTPVNEPVLSYRAGSPERAEVQAAIQELKRWLEEEPIVVPKPPEKKKDMTLGDRECKR